MMLLRQRFSPERHRLLLRSCASHRRTVEDGPERLLTRALEQTPEKLVQTDKKGQVSRWAFRSRDFRLFMIGNLISWVGDWMDLVALNWAVLSLFGSGLHLGLINAYRLAPVFVLSIPAGVLADRLDRRRLLFWLQTGTMVLTAFE